MGNSPSIPYSRYEHNVWHHTIMQVVHSPAVQDILRSFSIHLDKYPRTERHRGRRREYRDDRDDRDQQGGGQGRWPDEGFGGDEFQRAEWRLRQLEREHDQQCRNPQHAQRSRHRGRYDISEHRIASRFPQERSAGFDSHIPVPSEDSYHFARPRRGRSKAPSPQQPRRAFARHASPRPPSREYLLPFTYGEEDPHDRYGSRIPQRRRRRKPLHPHSEPDIHPQEQHDRSIRRDTRHPRPDRRPHAHPKGNTDHRGWRRGWRTAPMKRGPEDDESPYTFSEASVHSNEQRDRSKRPARRRPSEDETPYPYNQENDYAYQRPGRRPRSARRPPSNHGIPAAYPEANTRPHELRDRSMRPSRRRSSDRGPPRAYVESDDDHLEQRDRSMKPPGNIDGKGRRRRPVSRSNSMPRRISQAMRVPC